jgi:ankyrin repeat protein
LCDTLNNCVFRVPIHVYPNNSGPRKIHCLGCKEHFANPFSQSPAGSPLLVPCSFVVVVQLLIFSSPVINTMQRETNDQPRVENEASRNEKKRKRIRNQEFDYGLGAKILEDFDWSRDDSPNLSSYFTEDDLQLYMHDDLKRLLDGVPDEHLIPVLRQPRGEILLFIVRRIGARINTSQIMPQRYRMGRKIQKQLKANRNMQNRLYKIIRNEQGADPPNAAMIQMDNDLRSCLQEQRWEGVQRLLDTVPEGTFIPVLTDDRGWTLWHLAVDRDADLTIVKGLARVLTPGDMRNASNREYQYTALHHCYVKNAPSEIRDLILAAWPPAAFVNHLREVLDRKNGASKLSSLIDACPGAIDFIHDDGNGLGLGWSWSWKSLLHLALPKYLADTDDASQKFNNELDSLVKFLLIRKPELAGAIDEKLRTPLHLACSSCSFSTVKLIMACLPAEELKVCDIWRNNALHYAMNGSFEHPDRLKIVGELLHASYDLLYQECDDEYVCTPIDCLLENASAESTIGFLPCFQTIFAHGSHSDITRSGELVLHAAIYNEDLAMSYFRCLVGLAPEQAKEFDDTGNLPIHLAAQMKKVKCTHPGVEYHYLEIINELLDVFPEGLMTPNRDGMLPLQLMIKAGGRWRGGINTFIYVCPAVVCDLHLQGDSLATFLSRLDCHTMYKLLREVPQLLNP